MGFLCAEFIALFFSRLSVCALPLLIILSKMLFRPFCPLNLCISRLISRLHLSFPHVHVGVKLIPIFLNLVCLMFRMPSLLLFLVVASNYFSSFSYWANAKRDFSEGGLRIIQQGNVFTATTYMQFGNITEMLSELLWNYLFIDANVMKNWPSFLPC